MASTSLRQRGVIHVLLPALNEEEALRRLLPDIYHATDLIPARVYVIVIDDGSTDDTAHAAQFAPDPLPVQVFSHPRNLGLAEALRTGIEQVLDNSTDDGDVLVAMDADFTHPPETIPKMVGAIWDGEDIVIASRYQPGSEQVGVPRLRRFLSWGARRLFTFLLPIPGVRDFTCGFRAYRVGVVREAWRHFGKEGIITSEGFACTDEILVRLAMITDKIAEVPFTLRYDRKPGKSKLKLWKTIRAQIHVLGHLRRLRRTGLPKG